MQTLSAGMRLRTGFVCVGKRSFCRDVPLHQPDGKAGKDHRICGAGQQKRHKCNRHLRVVRAHAEGEQRIGESVAPALPENQQAENPADQAKGHRRRSTRHRLETGRADRGGARRAGALFPGRGLSLRAVAARGAPMKNAGSRAASHGFETACLISSQRKNGRKQFASLL